VVAPSLLQLANDRINQVAAYPIAGSALSPDLVGISLATTVTLAAGVSPAYRPAGGGPDAGDILAAQRPRSAPEAGRGAQSGTICEI